MKIVLQKSSQKALILRVPRLIYQEYAEKSIIYGFVICYGIYECNLLCGS
jgi:hypothetical protein